MQRYIHAADIHHCSTHVQPCHQGCLRFSIALHLFLMPPQAAVTPAVTSTAIMVSVIPLLLSETMCTAAARRQYTSTLGTCPNQYAANFSSFHSLFIMFTLRDILGE